MPRDPPVTSATRPCSENRSFSMLATFRGTVGSTPCATRTSLQTLDAFVILRSLQSRRTVLRRRPTSHSSCLDTITRLLHCRRQLAAHARPQAFPASLSDLWG